jgi:DNA-binding MarR family transcriptional regulator
MKSPDDSLAARAELPPLGTVLEFMRLVWALDHALQRTSKRMERTLGVTGPQRFVIRIVGRFPGIPAGDLAQLLHVHPSTLTGILARLKRAGLIRRHPDPRDRRRSLVGLTEKGWKLDVAAEGTVEAAVARALEGMSPAVLEAARKALQSVAASLASSAAGTPHSRPSVAQRAGAFSRPRRERAGARSATH